MAVATSPIGAANGELARRSFGLIGAHDMEPMRQPWTDASIERSHPGASHGAHPVARSFESLFAVLPGLHIEIVALDPKTRLLKQLRGRRRRR
jgi:hypothetical protein